MPAPIEIDARNAAEPKRRHRRSATSEFQLDPHHPRLQIEAEYEPATRSPRRYRAGLLLFLAYTLGPFAPLVLRQGSRNGWWSGMALAGVLTWGATILAWDRIHPWFESGTAPLLPWMLWLGTVTFLGTLAWARAVRLAGRDERFVPDRLPGWLRQPGICGVLGWVAPGAGHLVAGHPRRAALAVWNAGWSVLAALAVWWSEWLWRCNRAAGADGLPGTALEMLFLGAAAGASLGFTAWIAAGLEGAHLVGRRSGRRGVLRGDLIGFTLLASLGPALLAFHPAGVAFDLDGRARRMLGAGYRIAPLCMEIAAMQLDPAEPRYAMRAADLYDTLGRYAEARTLRDRLQQRWEIYAEGILREEVGAGPAPPAPAAPAPAPAPEAKGDDTP